MKVAPEGRIGHNQMTMGFVLRFAGREVLLAPGVVFIGRAEDVDLRLQDESVSRRHAALRVGADRVTVEDLDSANGVFVNNRRITETQEISPGDTMFIGSVQFLLEDEDKCNVFPSGATRQVREPSRSRKPSPYSIRALSLLSPREEEVLRMLALGLPQREIAEELGVSVKTVETYRARIADKLELKTRAQLVQYAVNAGILRPK